MMISPVTIIGPINTYHSSPFLLVAFLLRLQAVVSRRVSNHSCYTCLEPLVGFTDYSCRSFDASSSMAKSYAQPCHSDDNGTLEYECRKVIVSFRTIDTLLRRDCVPKGSCSWKDRTQSMMDSPVSNCVYTDEPMQKLECIYCCDTPLCNRTVFSRAAVQLIVGALLVYVWMIYT